MEPELKVGEDPTLAVVRRRGLVYLNYIFWALAVAALLVAANLGASLFGRWIALLEGVRRTLGFAAPAAGPDYWILGGGAVAVLACGVALVAGWSVYRQSWRTRLAGFDRAHVRTRRLRVAADDRERLSRSAYLEALAAWRGWQELKLGPDYCENAARALKLIEPEIAQRAVTTGLVVGLSRNRFVDSFSILAAALELQLFVLTRLGKEPSLRTWVELVKRTASSLFLNWYVSRGDALYIKLAIKKTAWGLGFASEVTQHAADSLDNFDWDEIMGALHGSLPPPALHALSALGTVAAKGMTVGAFGLRQLGAFIEVTADDLLEGVLAGGILYYHGMALAAECLSLDQVHRNSIEMNRTIGQAMTVACAPAGRLLLEQVRAMRQFLRERRLMMIASAKGASARMVSGIRKAAGLKSRAD